MAPVIFSCGFFTIYAYGVFVAAAFLVATLLLTQEARRKGLDEEKIYRFSIFLLVSGIIGARLFYVFLNWDYFSSHWTDILMLQKGGLVWFGGLMGATIAGVFYLWRSKMPVLKTADLFCAYLALAQAIGRIGCFFNGCCYGRESMRFGVYFPVHGKFLLPVQLFDSFTLLLIFVVLRLFSAHFKGQGRIFSVYLILAGLQRFGMEFLRADEKFYFLSLSVFQWISFFLVAGGFVLGFFLWKKKSL